jgi:hypothetical protein
MGQIAEVVLERREPRDDLAVDSERGHAVGNALLGIGNNVKDRPTQMLQGGALSRIERLEIVVDILTRHGGQRRLLAS